MTLRRWVFELAGRVAINPIDFHIDTTLFGAPTRSPGPDTERNSGELDVPLGSGRRATPRSACGHQTGCSWSSFRRQLPSKTARLTSRVCRGPEHGYQNWVAIAPHDPLRPPPTSDPNERTASRRHPSMTSYFGQTHGNLYLQWCRCRRVSLILVSRQLQQSSYCAARHPAISAAVRQSVIATFAFAGFTRYALATCRAVICVRNNW